MDSIDSIIVGIFLILNVMIGFFYSRKVGNIREYAIGKQDFTTQTLAATIIATWAGGQAFFTTISESYTHGIYFIWATVLGDFLCYIFIGLLFAPKMAQFLGKLSIADAMGDIYGQKIRIISSIAGSIGAAGMIAVQLKLTGVLFEYSLNLPASLGIVISTFIVLLYSSFGGIRAVAFTDVIQFFTFIVIIPLVAYTLINTTENFDSIINIFQHHPNFNPKNIFDFTNSEALFHFSIFLFFIVPSFNPAMFQRIAMAKNVLQVRDSFVSSAVICMIFALIVCWIGILTLAMNPDLQGDEIVKYIITSSANPGFRGFILVGIMAMILSTVDSFINSTSVLLVHDLFKPLKLITEKQELTAARIASVVIGGMALTLSMKDNSLLELIILTNSFYMPIVTIPFILAVFGFKPKEKSVLIGMGAGIVGIVLWDYILQIKSANSVPFGMLCNIFFISLSEFSTYNFDNHQKVFQKKLDIILKDKIKNFSFASLIKTLYNNFPKSEGIIPIIGFVIMISSFISVHSLPSVYRNQYQIILNIIYFINLFSAAVLISYFLWSQKLQNKLFAIFIWNFFPTLSLICLSFFCVLINNFSDTQLIIFMVNIIVIFSIMKWQEALFKIVLGIILTQFYFSSTIFAAGSDSAILDNYKVLSLLLLFTTIALVFLKPQQEYFIKTIKKFNILQGEILNLNGKVENLDSELVENREVISKLNEQVSHFLERIDDQNKEIERLGTTAQKILNNVNHELRLPIGNVLNFSEMLNEGLGRYSTEYLKELTNEVHKNSTKLSSMILNMLDLATLNTKKIELQKQLLNFSKLIEDRVICCKNFYVEDKTIEFQLLIEPQVNIFADANYIRQVIDNLVINAINFSTNGIIQIKLEKQVDMIIFSIQDQGIGIPPEDLYDIFTPFKMGSNTENKAKGRGLGLALCKAAVEAQGGNISVSSKQNRTIFVINFPSTTR